MKMSVMSISWLCVLLMCGSGQVFAQLVSEDFSFSADDAQAGDQLGWSIDVGAELIVVGAWNDDDNGPNSGSVYVFDRMSGAIVAKLLASDGSEGDVFGVSIAIGGGLIVVGARNTDEVGSNSGSAYLFDARTGVELFKLVADDAANEDRFGRAVGIDGGVVAVGSPLDDDGGASSGAVYLFDVSNGQQIAKIIAADGSAGDRFGFALAMDQGELVVGAYHDQENGVESGSVYVFDIPTRVQTQKIVPVDGTDNGVFGRTIDVVGGKIVIGAADKAYLYDATSGEKLFDLIASDDVSGADFGNSVSIDERFAVVGASFSSELGFGSGSAYVFDVGNGTQHAKLVKSDGEGLDFFGISVGVRDQVIGVGALGDDGVGSSSVFDFQCPADLSGDGELNFFDVSAFLELFAEQSPEADFNGDTRFNFFDVSAFLEEFAAGCP